MIKKILIACDGSNASHKAFQYGLDIAKKFGAQLELISVVQVLDPPEDVETKDYVERGKDYYNKVILDLESEASKQNVPITTEIVLGHPAQQIIHSAIKKKVDLIILGHQTKKTFGQWLLGSVPDRVVHHAPCSVLVVKTESGLSGH
jgi:nucleotide-binding universal stress UspA family protein